MNWKLLTSNKKLKLPYSANSWSFGGCFWSTDARQLWLYERNFYICLPPWEYLSSYSWVWDGNCRPVLKVQGFQLINLWLQKFITFFFPQWISQIILDRTLRVTEEMMSLESRTVPKQEDCYQTRGRKSF